MQARPQSAVAPRQHNVFKNLMFASEIIRYNAYRLLNDIYGTHFDLQRILFAEKYALSFLDPIAEKEQNAARLKVYWEKRLKQDR